MKATINLDDNELREALKDHLMKRGLKVAQVISFDIKRSEPHGGKLTHSMDVECNLAE